MGEEPGALGGGQGLQEAGEVRRGVRQGTREAEQLLVGEERSWRSRPAVIPGGGSAAR